MMIPHIDCCRVRAVLRFTRTGLEFRAVFGGFQGSGFEEGLGLRVRGALGLQDLKGFGG